MRCALLVAASLVLPFAGLAAQRQRAPLQTRVQAARQDSLFTSQIRPDAPGCAVGVYRNGQVVVAKGYGLANVEERRPITAQTAFNMGSVAKPFTALAALLLERDGKLSLDDDVRRWLPELPDYGAPIRIRDLLWHTSGLRDYGAFNALTGRSIASMPEFMGRMAAQRALNFPTGTRHEYSHSDFTLLGLVIERIVAIPFGEHLEKAVLAPMGMRGSFVHDDRPRVRTNRAFGHVASHEGTRVIFPSATVVAGTNLYVSVADLAHWDRNFDDPKVGGAGIINQMLSRPTLASGDTIPYAYGLRLGRYRGPRTVSRGGHEDGMMSEIIRFPEHHFTVAVLCNAEHLRAGQLAQNVADIYLDSVMQPARPRPLPPATVAVPPKELARYAGVYRSPDLPWLTTPIEVRDGVLNEVLFHEERDDTLIAMTPAGDGRFVEIGTTGNIAIFAFTPTSDGKGMRFALTWNGEPADEAERIPDSLLWRPSAEALAEYEGTWISEELGQSWRLERHGERLVLRRDGLHDLTLRPVERDMFVRGFGNWASALHAQLLFQRNENGQITRLVVSTATGEDSAVGLMFTKVR